MDCFTVRLRNRVARSLVLFAAVGSWQAALAFTPSSLNKLYNDGAVHTETLVGTANADSVTVTNGSTLNGDITLMDDDDSFAVNNGIFSGNVNMGAGSDGIAFWDATISGNIDGGANVDVVGLDGPGNRTFSNQFISVETLVKEGNSRWTLDYAGQINQGLLFSVMVDKGELLIDAGATLGTAALTKIDISFLGTPASLLGRDGTVVGSVVNVNSFGTIGVAGANRTLTVVGSVCLFSYATIETRIDNLNGGTVVVSGGVSVFGPTNVKVIQNNPPTETVNYTVLTAGGGIVIVGGSFVDGGWAAANSSTLTQYSWLQSANALTLHAAVTPFGQMPGLTANQQQVGNALYAGRNVATGDLANMLRLMRTSNNPAQITTILDSFSAESYAGAPAVVGYGAANTMFQTLNGRLGETRQPAPLTAATFASAPMFAGPVAVAGTEPAPRPWSLWGTAVGSEANQQSTRDGSGYDITQYGLVTGLDRDLGPFRLGLSLGGINSRVNLFDGIARTDAETLLAGVYGGYTQGPYFADLGFLAGYSQYDGRRFVPALGEKAHSDYDGYQFSLGGKTGYTFDLNSWRLTPHVGLMHTMVTTQSFREDDAGVFNLDVDSNSSRQLTGQLGVKLERDFEIRRNLVLRPDVHAAWNHDFMNNESSIRAGIVALPGSSFTSTGVEPARDGIVLGTGLAVVLSEAVTLRAGYDCELKDGYVGHSVNAGLQYDF